MTFPPPRTFHIQTFGCQMNAHDSDWLSRSLAARGFVESPFEEASLYIINTCSVRDKPEQKVYSELGRIARNCKVTGRTGVTVCVGGCVAQQVGSALTRRFPQVRLVFGTDGIAHAPEAIERLMEEPRLRLNLLEFLDRYEERATSHAPGSAPPSAFVNIMQGCDNFCTYCIVPYVRGRQKSRDPAAVLAECRALIEAGAREITLLGQNVNSYGQDAPEYGVPFAKLLRRVAALPGLARLRFITPHPKDIADEVIDAFGSLDNLCPRLHLPLQSGSDRILAKMGRRYDTARYLDIVRKLRSARPDMAFSTDIIVGFPGETEDDFASTMAMMEQVGFMHSFSFVYSDRPHAKAVLLPGKVERAVALERLSRLQAWQNQASDSILASMVGSTVTILIEGKSQRAVVLDEQADMQLCEEPGEAGTAAEKNADATGWQGKTPHGLIVNVSLPDLPGPEEQPGPTTPGGREKGWEGALLPVRIEVAARHSLKGRQAGEPW